MINNWILYILLAVVALCSTEQGWSKDHSHANAADVVLQILPSCEVSDDRDGKVTANLNMPVSITLYSIGTRRDVMSKEESKQKKCHKDFFAGCFNFRHNSRLVAEMQQGVSFYYDKTQSRLAFLQRLNI